MLSQSPNTLLFVGSSIIFLVVIAIWAVFLLPDLQIRRHQLAEARATNRMLSTSRVLKRDNPFRPEAGTVESDATSMTPAPERALTASSGGSTAITAMSEPDTELLDMSAVLTGEERPAEEQAPRREKRPARASRSTDRTLAWVLAGCLLTSIIAVPLTVILSALSVLAWWSVLIALVALAGCVVALRYRATRRRAARSVARAAASPVPPRAERVIDLRDDTSVARTREPAARPRTEAAFDQTRVDDDDEEAEPSASATVEPGPTAPPTNPRPVIDDRPGVWTPPKVPRPTYLMKPRLPQGPLVPPNIGVTTTRSDPFGDLLESGQDEGDLPESRAV